MGFMCRRFIGSGPVTMGSDTPETQARAVRAPAADAVARLRLLARPLRQGLALALGLTGLAAAVLIALFLR
jgi:hypothetical protein